MSKRKAMIWGVTGQDGSYLADFLLAHDYHVVGVSRRVSVPTDERLVHIKDRSDVELVEGDVTDSLCVYRLLDRHEPDEVYNLAAQSHVQVSFSEPAHTFDVTARGTLNILEWLRSWHVRNPEDPQTGPRFYQASSSEMFGCSRCYNNVSYYQDEDTPFLPQSPYAIAKLAAHHTTRLYREAYGVYACSGILFNHESPRRGRQFVTKKITEWVARVAYARRHEKPPEPIHLGNLDASRDWGFAGDYIQAMWLMLQQDSPDDYVIATGETHTVREFLTEALAVIGVRFADNMVVQDPHLVRPAEVPYLRGDASRARRVFGWRPKVAFKDLVRMMVLSDMDAMYDGQLHCHLDKDVA